MPTKIIILGTLTIDSEGSVLGKKKRIIHSIRTYEGTWTLSQILQSNLNIEVLLRLY